MELSRTDIETAMRRALDLAARGPATGINPQVGCVLLDDDGTIVAEGWHRGAGTAHAEADALSNLATATATATATGTGTVTAATPGGDAANPDVQTRAAATVLATTPGRGLTAVVTLEPCNHTGRTGPCTEALIAAGITRVVYAVSDPGPLAGGGAARLAEAGVSVTGGVLAETVAGFGRQWLTAVTLRRPYVILKWASTLDGRAAASDGTSQWITGTASLRRVHEQRTAVDAILVGTGTVLADDPSLTARGTHDELLDHQPVPVVIGHRAVPADARLRQHPAGMIETGSRDLPAVLSDLFDRGIRRIIVEGGPTLATAFVAADLVNEYAIFLGPSLLGGSRLVLGDIGVSTLGERKNLRLVGVEQLGDDVFVSAVPVVSATPVAAAVPVVSATRVVSTTPVVSAEHATSTTPAHALRVEPIATISNTNGR